MKSMACALALATGAGLGVTAHSTLAAPLPVLAASGLQIAVASAGATSDDSAVALELSYRGGVVGNVELYIDGTLVNRRAVSLRTKHGVIRFELDPTLLTDGDHEVLVKAVDLDGNTATATTRLRSAQIQNGPVRLMSPRKNSKVQGIVPIEIKLDDSIRKPFVGFWIDTDFKTLSNYAPFAYNWDSSTAANGLHTIVIELLDGETSAKIKTITFQVEVNNPGGLTNRQKITPDLKEGPLKPPIALPGAVEPLVSEPSERLNMPGFTVPVSDRTATRLGNASTLRTARPAPRLDLPAQSEPIDGVSSSKFVAAERIQTPNGIAPSAKSLQTRISNALRPGISTSVGASAKHEFVGISATSVRPAIVGLFAVPKTSLKLSLPSFSAGKMAPTKLQPRRAGNIAVIPAVDDVVTPATERVVSSGQRIARSLSGVGHLSSMATFRKPVVAFTPLRSTVRAIVGVGGMVGGRRNFVVAYDSKVIKFDVKPRVEHGVPLAPFRQIFEHSGGVVEWVGKTQTVRAVNSTRNIEFQVGKLAAKVNSAPVQLEARPFVEKGRTIVPMSFVRDSLDVKVQYDPVTGHLKITSNK